MKKKRFQVGDSFYEIPDNEVSAFLTDNPKAVEVRYYDLNGSKYNIPIAEVDAFESEMGLKKKETSKVGSLVGGAVGTSVPQSGAVPPQQLKTKLQEQIESNKKSNYNTLSSYLTGLKTPEEKKLAQETQETIKNKSYQEGQKRLSEYMGVSLSDPVGTIISSANKKTDPDDIVKDFMAKKTLEDFTQGFAAKNMLGKGFTGATETFLKEKADKYDKVAQPFRDLTFTYGNQEADAPENDYTAKDKMYDAAIRAYANKNPLFKKQAEAAGVDLSSDNLRNKLGDKGTAGIAMSEILMDDDFVDFVQNENPKYLNITKDIADNLLSDNREYGVNVVSNEMSRERQKKGFNNPIVEFDDKRFKDENDLVAKQLYANDPQKMKIYQDVISQNPDKYIDTPSLIEGFAQGAEGVYKGVGNTFEAPFNSIPQQIKEGWDKEASHVTADPKGVSKFLSGTGHVLGLVSALGGVSNVLGAGGAGVYSKNVAPLLAGTVPFAGDFWKEAVMKYPDSPTKAALSTTLNTALYGALSQRIFPAKEVQQAFSKVKPEIAQIVENLSSGKITREVARQKANTLIRQGFDFLKGATSKSAKISAELTGIAAANRAIDKLFMDEQDFEKYHPEGELQDSFKTLFLDNLVLGGMTKYSDMKKGNAIVEESLYEAATNPLRYKRVIDEMEVKDPSISKDNMLSNLGFLSMLKIDLDKRGVSEKNQKRYLFEAMKERAIKQQISEMPESNITRRGQEQIKRGEEIKDAILNGEDAENVLTEADRKEAEENNKAQAEKNKLTEKGQKAVDKLLEQKDEEDKPVFKGMYRDIAKADPMGFLQEVADQVFGMERINGERVKSKSEPPSEESIVKRYTADVVNAAKELFPLEAEKSEIDQQRDLDMGTEPVSEPPSISVQMPKYESKFPKPEKPLEELNSEELFEYSKKIREYNKNIEKEFFGEEGAKRYKVAKRVSNSITATRDEVAEADRVIKDMEDSLSEQQRDEFFGIGFDEEGIYDPSELADLSQRISFIEDADNVQGIAKLLKLPLLEFSRGDKPTKASLVVLNAARKRAEQLDISTEDLIKESIANVAKEIKDPEDAYFLAKSVFDKLAKPITEETQKQLVAPAETITPTAPQAEAKVTENWGKDVESTAKALEGADLNKMPNVSWHGSKNKNLIFGKPKEGSRSKSNMQLDFGTHFTSEDYASFYEGDKGKKYPAIIDLKMPLDLTQGMWWKDDPNFNAVYQLIKDLKLEKSYGSVDFVDKDGNRQSDIQGVSINAHKLTDLPPKKVSDALKKNGFDGIIYEPYHPKGDKYYEAKPKSFIVLDNASIKEPTPKNISEAYHKAKADGTNPELVKTVEDLLGKPQAEAAKTTVSDAEALPVAYGKAETKVQPKPSTQSTEAAASPQVDEKVVKSRVKRIAKSLNVDEQRSQQIHDIALKAKDYEDFKKQVADLIGDDTVNENRIAEQYDEVRGKAKSEYEKELEKNLEDLRAAYTDATKADAALKKMNESPKSVRGFIKRLLTGATPESVAANKARLVEMQRKYRKEKANMRAMLPRERGANFVVEKLSRAARNGEISQEAADLAIDLIRKQPDMFGDLAISITGKKGENDGVQGWYRAADALVKLFKNPSDPTTAVHELLHHTERFLPHEIRDKIIAEWNNEVNLQIADIQKKLKTETNTDKRQQLIQGLLYLGLAQERQLEPNIDNVQSMERIMSKYLGDYTDSQGNFHKGLGNSWYQLYNPSEWWAVNASRLFREAKNKPELKTWTDKVKAFYNYLIDAVKRAFKGSPTAAVEKGLKAVLNGDVLEDREGAQLSASQKLLNIKKKGSFEDKLKSIYDEVNKGKALPQSTETPTPKENGKPEGEASGEKLTAEPPPGEPAEPEGEMPERRFTNQMLRSDELSEQSKAEIAKTLNYVRQTNEMSVKEANAVLDQVGVDEAQRLVMSEGDLKPVVRVTLGQILIKRLNDMADKAVDQAEKDYYLDRTIETASYVTEKLATEAGQSIQAFSMWSRLSPEGQLRAANQDMARQGKEKMARRSKDINAIGNKFQKANEEAADELTKSEPVKAAVKKTESKRVTKAKDKVAKAKEKRKKLFDKYKGKKGGGLTLSTGGLSKEGIEYVGELVKTYIEEGVAKAEVAITEIVEHLKSIGANVTDNVQKNVADIIKEYYGKEGDKRITKGLAELETEVGKIVKEHYTVSEEAKKKLVDKFMDTAGLEKEEAEQLSKEIEAEFDKIATRKKRNILYNEKARFDKINNTLNPDPKKEGKSIQSELIKYSNLGAFELKDFEAIIADKFGIGKLNAEQAAKLKELADKVQKAPEGTPKRDATEDLLAYRAKLKGNDLGETVQGVWYANVLSGYRTHEKNLISTFFNSIGELAAEMFADPKSIPHLMAGYMKGVFTRGRVEAANTMATGRSPIHIKKIETPNVLERKSFKGGNFNPANWFKYVMRLMVAEDVLSFQGLKEARAYQLARKEASRMGVNTWTKKGWDKVNEILYHTKERWSEAEKQVDAEELTGKRERKRRIYELMEESRPQEMTADAYGFAAKGTFNHESEGSLGALTNAISAALDSVSVGGVKPLRFIVPFTRIITNVVNNSLDYTPIGAIRAARGVRGFKAFENNYVTKPAYKELSKDERKRLVAKAAMGITLAATFQALHQAGIIQITGAGPDDEKKKAQLRQSGWQEYSIKIGGKYYSYKYTPLVFNLGFLGNMNDAAEYSEEDMPTIIKRMELAASKMAGQVADMTWINSASTFLGSLTEPNIKQQEKGINDALAGMTRGFIPYAGAITQGNQLVQSIWGMPQKQVNGSWQALIQDIPIARNMLNDKINALGDPITRDIDVVISRETKDPVWKFLLDHQGWVAPVNRGTLVVFDQNDKKDRPFTSDEYYNFSKIRGGILKDGIKELMGRQDVPVLRNGQVIEVAAADLTKKEFNKYLSKLETAATKLAKLKMFGEVEKDEYENELKKELEDAQKSFMEDFEE